MCAAFQTVKDPDSKKSDEKIRRFLIIVAKIFTGDGRYKVQPIFEYCTLFFRKFTVVPYKHPFSQKFSELCTLYTRLFRKPYFWAHNPNFHYFLPFLTRVLRTNKEQNTFFTKKKLLGTLVLRRDKCREIFFNLKKYRGLVIKSNKKIQQAILINSTSHAWPKKLVFNLIFQYLWFLNYSIERSRAS